MKKLIGLILITISLNCPAIAGECPQDSGNTLHDANLRQGPGLNHEVIMVLLKGSIIYPKNQQGQWLQVEAPQQNRMGWLHNSLVGSRTCPDHIITLHPLRLKAKKEKPPVQGSNDPAPTRSMIPSATRLAVIDIQQILNQSIQGQRARASFNAARTGANATATLAREEEIISRIVMEIRAVAELYAEKHKFSHILNKNSGAVFYTNPSHDITNAIIKAYDRQILSTTAPSQPGTMTKKKGARDSQNRTP